MRVPELAARLGVGRSTIFAWLNGSAVVPGPVMAFIGLYDGGNENNKNK